MVTDHTLEVLSTAYDAMTRARLSAEANPTAVNFRAEVKAESCLFDACIDAGMSLDEPVITKWAAIRIAAWLSSSNTCDCGATVASDEDECAACIAEYRAELACGEDLA